MPGSFGLLLAAKGTCLSGQLQRVFWMMDGSVKLAVELEHFLDEQMLLSSS
jgi:hypothetical protein